MKNKTARPQNEVPAITDWRDDPRIGSGAAKVQAANVRAAEATQRVHRIDSQLKQVKRAIAVGSLELLLGKVAQGTIDGLQDDRDQLELDLDVAQREAAAARESLEPLTDAMARLEAQVRQEVEDSVVDASRPIVEEMIPLVRRLATLNDELHRLHFGVSNAVLRPIPYMELHGDGGGVLGSWIKEATAAQ